MKLPEYIIGTIVNRSYDHDYQKLFDQIEFPKMEQQDCISFEQLITKKLMQGDQISQDSLVLTSINDSTIIFSFYLFNQDHLLEKLSINSRVLRFYMNQEQQIFVFSIFENGKLIRDNFSDDDHKEIGEPLEIETQTTNKVKIIQHLITEMIGGELAMLNSSDYYIYRQTKSLFSRIFK